LEAKNANLNSARLPETYKDKLRYSCSTSRNRVIMYRKLQKTKYLSVHPDMGNGCKHACSTDVIIICKQQTEERRMQPARYLNGERRRRRRQRYNEEEEDLTRFHFISVGGRPIYSTPHWANIPTGTDCRANNEQYFLVLRHKTNSVKSSTKALAKLILLDKRFSITPTYFSIALNHLINLGRNHHQAV
jgi:hypothetical protein